MLEALHSSPVGGHSGTPATIHKIRSLFFWPGLRDTVLKYVQACTVCAQAKPDHAGYPGLLHPLPVPRQSWEVITMDFVDGLPVSGNVNSLLVVVDKFSKFTHFVPLCHPYTAAGVARVFMDNIFKLHGMPLAIVSDRDRIFTSNF